MRALKPSKIVVLREGERSLLQATLSDADGRGLPSAERLKGATLMCTPATNDWTPAVEVQRDGAPEPLQQGKAPALTLQKRALPESHGRSARTPSSLRARVHSFFSLQRRVMMHCVSHPVSHRVSHCADVSPYV